MAFRHIDLNDENFISRFWDKIDVRGNNECWPWTAGKTKGYGQIKVGPSMVYATQVALVVAGVPRPEGMFALHSCDNPACCNPKHLRWGTPLENAEDAMIRGRLRPISWAGKRVPASKLFPEQVLEIIKSNDKHAILAKRYNVATATIWRIKRGKSWKSIVSTS